MQFLIWGGALITMLGVAGLVFVGLKVGAAKRKATDDETLRNMIQGLLPLNLGALFVSAIGLMMVIVGLAFG